VTKNSRGNHEIRGHLSEKHILGICPDIVDCTLTFGYFLGKHLPAVEHPLPEFELDRDS
jgi:hypothetical protein